MYYKDIKRSKALIIYYKSKVKRLDSYLIDIIAIVRRVKKQERVVLTLLSIFIKNIFIMALSIIT